MGKIILRSDGRYMGRKQVDGKTKYFYGSTEREVKKQLKLYDIKIARGEGGIVEDTLGTYMTQWLNVVKAQPGRDERHKKLAEQSINRLRSTIKVHILPALEDYKLKSLTAMIIEQEVFNVMLEKKLSMSSVKKAYDALNECLRYAVDARQLDYNPMKQIELPEKRIYADDPEEDEEKIRIFTVEELEKIEKAIHLKLKSGGYKYRNSFGYTLMLNTGCRPGEITATNWQDLLTEYNDAGEIIYSIRINKTIIISKDPDRIPKDMPIIQPFTKTKAGRRNVYLNDAAVIAINELKKISKGMLILDNHKGKIVAPNSFAKNFLKLVKEAGIENPCTVYDLRHTYATKLFREGIDFKTASEILGQADMKVYLKYYVAVENKDKELIMTKIKF